MADSERSREDTWRRSPAMSKTIPTVPTDQRSLTPCRRRFTESFKRDAVRLRCSFPIHKMLTPVYPPPPHKLQEKFAAFRELFSSSPPARNVKLSKMEAALGWHWQLICQCDCRFGFYTGGQAASGTRAKNSAPSRSRLVMKISRNQKENRSNATPARRPWRTARRACRQAIWRL